MTVDEIKKLLHIITNNSNNENRFKQMSEVIFKREIAMMVATNMKFATIRALLQNTMEYIFALQYADETGTYQWKLCTDAMEALKESMIEGRGEARGAARGRASAAASAAGGGSGGGSAAASPAVPMQLG